MLPHKSVDECDVLVHYLFGIPPTPRARASYYRALQNMPITFSDKQQSLWESCLKKNWLLAYVDAYLGFTQPTHPIRQKIFIMLAVLETQPEFSSFFLPKRGSFFDFVVVMAKGIHAVMKIFIGRVVTWLI